MDQFTQSMSILLHRMLMQAENAEAALNKNQIDVAKSDVAALIIQTGQLIQAFQQEIKSG